MFQDTRVNAFAVDWHPEDDGPGVLASHEDAVGEKV